MWSGRLRNSCVERILFPFICVQHVYLLRSSNRPIFRIKELDLSRSCTTLWTLTAEVQVDRTVETLDLILNKERNLNVSVFEEFVDLLTNNLVVVWLVVRDQNLEIFRRRDNLHLCW